MDFKGKTIVITGGSSGLGLALAKYFSKQEAKIVLIARNKEKLLEAEKALRECNPKVRVINYSVDISQENRVADLPNAIAKEFGAIDVLINSAGILYEGYFENTSLDTFKNIQQTNFLALVNMTQAFLPYLKQSKGRIVNIASMASYFGTFGYTAYCASKFAVLGFSEALRYELRPQGVRLHVVCPPEFEGPMVEGITEGRTPENQQIVQSAGVLSVDDVLKETIKGIEKNKFIIQLGRSARAAAFFNRLFPSLVRALVDKRIKGIYQGPKTS
jgi:3-dehydrosphinganine reductase